MKVVNNLYDLQYRISQLSDSIAKSGIEDIILYSAGAVVVFILVVLAIFGLIMVFRR